MTEERTETVLSPEEEERLHSAIAVIDHQLADIYRHKPELFGPALLSMMTFLVEKTYFCSTNYETSQQLVTAAQEAGLQAWLDYNERQKSNGKDGPAIVTLDG